MDTMTMIGRTPADVYAFTQALNKEGATLDEDIAEYHAYMDLVCEIVDRTPSGNQLSEWMSEMCAMALAPYSMIARTPQELEEPVEAACAMLIKLGTREELLSKAAIYAAHSGSARYYVDESMGPKPDPFLRSVEAHVRADMTMGGYPLSMLLRGSYCTMVLDARGCEPAVITTRFRIPKA